MKKLAIITTHPIQYNAPLFQELAQNNLFEIKVFYTWSQSTVNVYDPGFLKVRSWDVPVLEGYNYTFVTNTAKNHGSRHFFGMINPTLIQEIEDWGADAVMVFGWCFQSHLKCLRHFKGKIPVFFRGDSTLLDEKPGIKQFLRRQFLRWVYQHVDVAFYVGKNNRQYFLKHGLKKSQLAYAPHAIDIDRFADNDLDKKLDAINYRKKLGIKENDLVILFVGKLEPKKNPSFILKLADRIKSDSVKFVIVGEGVLKNELQQQAAGDDRIKFLGFLNQSLMPVIYRMAGLFILPSVGPGETWGLAANEAMACGLPVLVSSKVGCAPDLVIQKENGLVFHPADVNSVANYILELKDNSAQLEIAKQKALNHIQKFNYKKIASVIENKMASRQIAEKI